MLTVNITILTVLTANLANIFHFMFKLTLSLIVAFCASNTQYFNASIVLLHLLYSSEGHFFMVRISFVFSLRLYVLFVKFSCDLNCTKEFKKIDFSSEFSLDEITMKLLCPHDRVVSRQCSGKAFIHKIVSY